MFSFSSLSPSSSPIKKSLWVIAAVDATTIPVDATTIQGLLYVCVLFL